MIEYIVVTTKPKVSSNELIDPSEYRSSKIICEVKGKYVKNWETTPAGLVINNCITYIGEIANMMKTDDRFLLSCAPVPIAPTPVIIAPKKINAESIKNRLIGSVLKSTLPISMGRAKSKYFCTRIYKPPPRKSHVNN